MNLPLRCWIALPACLLSTACSQARPDLNAQQSTPPYRPGTLAESLAVARSTDTTYQRRMFDLMRRTRLVPTDSLARLYIALDTAPDSVKWRVRRAVACTYLDLGTAHGSAAMIRATDRMMDSLAQTGYDTRHIDDKMMMIEGPGPEISYETCGAAMFKRARLPDSLDRLPLPAPRSRQ